MNICMHWHPASEWAPASARARGEVVVEVARLAQNDVVAVLQHRWVFQGVEGDLSFCAAINCSEVGLENMPIVHVADAEPIHAPLKEAVFSAVLAQRFLAVLGVVEVQLHRRLREYL